MTEGKEDMEQRPNRDRHLDTCEDDRIWEHNAWDNIPWTPDQQAQVLHTIQTQRDLAQPLSPQQLHEHCEQAGSKWDAFYANHSRWFFKDRKWLEMEFPEVFDLQNLRIWEVGCGAGNTLFPLCKARSAKGPVSGEMIYACDFSQNAVDLVRGSREYDPAQMCAFQHDLTAPQLPEEIQEASLDVILAIFVLSALPPSKLHDVFQKLYRALKPGGLLLFRDYGRGDLTQLRFKPQRLLDANNDFYQRGDGTDVHFFTEEECADVAQAAGFLVEENVTDRRVIVNRLRKLTMFRVWQQGKYRKPHTQPNKGC